METQDAMGVFLAQSHDHLDRLEHELVMLERDPASVRLLNRVVGIVHTLGVSGVVLGLTRLPALVDGAEALLGQISRGRVAFSPDGTHHP